MNVYVKIGILHRKLTPVLTFFVVLKCGSGRLVKQLILCLTYRRIGMKNMICFAYNLRNATMEYVLQEPIIIRNMLRPE